MNQAAVAAMRLIEAFVALIVGRRVPISWDNRASLDSQGTIHLPRPKTGDAAEIGLLTRLAVHEAGHVLHTEKGFADRLDKVELIIFNVLEDPRMEREQCSQYPGAGLILTRGLDEMLQGLETSWEAECPQPGRALALDLLVRGFLQLAPHEPIVRRAPRMLELLAPAISPKEREAIEVAAAEIPAASNSIDAENIARALVARLRQQEVSPPAQEPASDQQQEPADDEDSDADSSGQDPDQVQQAGNKTATDSPESDASGEGQGDSSQQDQNNGQPKPVTDEDPTEARSQDADKTDAGPPDAGGTGDAASQAETADDSDGAEGDGQSAQPGSDSQGNAPPDGPTEEISDEPQQQAGEGTGNAALGSPGGGGGGDASQGSSDDDADGAGETERTGDELAQTGPSGGQGSLEMEQVQPFDMGSLLRQTIAERYGAPDDDQDDAAAPNPISDDELERVRVSVMAADADGDLEQLLEASLKALVANDAGDELAEGSLAGGASMSLAGGEGQAEPLALDLRLQGVQARLVSVLQREFQDRKRRPTKAANAGGRIIAQRHWRLARLGDTRVFAKKRIANGIEAAATLLVDSSYSMKDRLQPALEVTLAFSLALQRLGVRTKVVRFPASDTVLLETLQQFGESPRRCTERCRGLSADGGTPIGAATAIETEMLLQQNRLKNFLAIVTDDEPGDPDTYLAALAQARELDVQVVGVGIGCDISQWIPESVSITNVDQLPDALSALFRSSVVMKLAA